MKQGENKVQPVTLAGGSQAEGNAMFLDVTTSSSC
jgi:hypothetical protein